MKQITSPYETYHKPNWWKRNWIVLTTLFGGLVAINLIFIASVYRETDTVNPVTAGQLGDFVGGYVGTIFALVSVVLLYLTLTTQRKSATIEKFGNKYFELIKLHRDNVAEIGIGEDFGKKIFVLMVREFRAILGIAQDTAVNLQADFTNEKFFVISYYALFYGVGPNSSRQLKAALENFGCKAEFIRDFEKTLSDESVKKKVKEDRKFRFTPFEGHQSRLGHYYRHLYQTVCYVDNKDLGIDKYEYVKTVRAQLTTHEQVLLFINALTPMGEKWIVEGLLLRYRMVKNIPKDFFDFKKEIDITTHFPKNYFEWQEEKVSAAVPDRSN